jgi:hypothetical protein
MITTVGGGRTYSVVKPNKDIHSREWWDISGQIFSILTSIQRKSAKQKEVEDLVVVEETQEAMDPTTRETKEKETEVKRRQVTPKAKMKENEKVDREKAEKLAKLSRRWVEVVKKPVVNLKAKASSKFVIKACPMIGKSYSYSWTKVK